MLMFCAGRGIVPARLDSGGAHRGLWPVRASRGALA